MTRLYFYLLMSYALGLTAQYDVQLSTLPEEEHVFFESPIEDQSTDRLLQLATDLNLDPSCFYRIKSDQEESWSQWNLLFSGSYAKPEYASNESWTAVQPYLLPENSPLKSKLDRIFSHSRVIADKDSLIEAGFNLAPTQGLHVVAAFHRDLKGYLIKVVLDKYDFNTEGKGEDWQHWIKRIRGEHYIRAAIAELNYKNYFKVPKQWIYPLPAGPKCPEQESYIPKSYILVVEDAKLESYELNSKFYRRMSNRMLDAIYHITTQFGLSDCCNKNNLPLCKDGKLAFVDTETFQNWPVNYHQLLQNLSIEKREYWKKKYK